MARSIRPYLEYQADRVEAVLAQHRSPARVTGGTVGPRSIRFLLNPAPNVRFAAIKHLADDLALAMRVSHLSISHGDQGIVLEFANPEPRPVALLPLLLELLPVPLSTATLGLTHDGVPLLARLAAPDVAHILVAGTTGSGKSVLLRTIALSLALAHRPAHLRLLCLDPKGRTFAPLAGLPHLLRPPVTQPAEALEALLSAVRTMELRDQRGERPLADPNDPSSAAAVPRVVILVDELADLVMLGQQALSDALTRLAQRGREAGIHLVAATQRPSSALLGGLMRANFPLRLVGKVVSAEDARIASGRAATDAHLLTGKGDFLAVSGADAPIRFQVATLSDAELSAEVARLRPNQLKAIAG